MKELFSGLGAGQALHWSAISTYSTYFHTLYIKSHFIFSVGRCGRWPCCFRFAPHVFAPEEQSEEAGPSHGGLGVWCSIGTLNSSYKVTLHWSGQISWPRLEWAGQASSLYPGCRGTIPQSWAFWPHTSQVRVLRWTISLRRYQGGSLTYAGNKDFQTSYRIKQRDSLT